MNTSGRAPSDSTEATTEINVRALGILLNALLLVLPAIFGVMLLTGFPAAQLLVMGGMVLWGVLAWLIYRAGRREASVATVVIGLIVIGAAFAAAYGSIRSIGSALSLAGIAAAGVFLERRSLIAAVVFSAVTFGALVVGERIGLIGPPADIQVGLVHWLTYVAIFGSIGWGTHRARVLLLSALADAQRSARHFADLFNLVPVSLMVSRAADGRILEVNAADERHLGYGREERIGRSTLDTGWRDPEDRRRMIAQLDAQGSVSGFEARQRNRAGEAIDVQLWATRVEVDGDPCLLTAALNVTERKRDERLLLETAAGVAGESGERLFRSLVQQLAVTLDCQIAICGQFTASGFHALAMIQDGTPMPYAQLDIAGTPCADLPADGAIAFTASGIAERYPASADVFPRRVEGHVGMLLRDVAGKPLGALCAFSYRPLAHTTRLEALFRIFAARAEAELRDLQREREIRLLNRQLETRVRERTADLETISSTVSHNLKAPLDTLIATAEALRRELGTALPAEALRHLDRIDADAGEAARLAEELAEFSRLRLRSGASGEPR